MRALLGSTWQHPTTDGFARLLGSTFEVAQEASCARVSSYVAEMTRVVIEWGGPTEFTELDRKIQEYFPDATVAEVAHAIKAVQHAVTIQFRRWAV